MAAVAVSCVFLGPEGLHLYCLSVPHSWFHSKQNIRSGQISKILTLFCPPQVAAVVVVRVEEAVEVN